MFKELFTEAFAPSIVSYGTNYPDLNDMKIVKLTRPNITVTLFRTDGDVYAVHLSEENELVFSFISNYTNDTLEKNIIGNTTMVQQNTKNAVKVFNKVFYVGMQIIKKVKPDEFSFEGFSESLRAVYSKLVQNKSFIKELEKAGYEFDAEQEEIFYFMKIEK